jgi:anhydro-N-acetylmuramic acid kinase
MALGLMSGTSLDGLDLCLTRFWPQEEQWNYEIVEAETLQYSSEWENRLRNASTLEAVELHLLDREYGSLVGKLCRDFLDKHHLEADLIASHGHTIFHQPQKRMSVQIGHGAFIAAASGVDVVNDFRSTDTAYGGQGAPLVPLAEQWLFHNFYCFLNIGGIANLSIHQAKGKIVGFDVCGANQVLNWISQKYFQEKYDEGGNKAAEGKIIPDLLQKLNKIDFYKKAPPRSLGREDVEKDILPLLKHYANGYDLLHTYNNHMAQQINIAFKAQGSIGSVLLSGGGVHNQFLLSLLKAQGLHFSIPDPTIIDFKEALCFCLLGLFRLKKIPNSLSSVTGASKDSIGGSHYLA